MSNLLGQFTQIKKKKHFQVVSSHLVRGGGVRIRIRIRGARIRIRISPKTSVGVQISWNFFFFHNLGEPTF